MKHFFILLSLLVLIGCPPGDSDGIDTDDVDSQPGQYESYDEIQYYTCASGTNGQKYELFTGYHEDTSKPNGDGSYKGGDLCDLFKIIPDDKISVYKSYGNKKSEVYAIDKCKNYIETKLENCRLTETTPLHY